LTSSYARQPPLSARLISEPPDFVRTIALAEIALGQIKAALR
jgi:hypothetical protein